MTTKKLYNRLIATVHNITNSRSAKCMDTRNYGAQNQNTTFNYGKMKGEIGISDVRCSIARCEIFKKEKHTQIDAVLVKIDAVLRMAKLIKFMFWFCAHLLSSIVKLINLDVIEA